MSFRAWKAEAFGLWLSQVRVPDDDDVVQACTHGVCVQWASVYDEEDTAQRTAKGLIQVGCMLGTAPPHLSG